MPVAIPAALLIVYSTGRETDRARAIGGLAWVVAGLIAIALTDPVMDDEGGVFAIVTILLLCGLLVEVRNDAAATSSALAATGSGLGLPGMRERVESLGGRLHAGPTSGGGWRLTARLPIRLPAVAQVP